MVDLSGENDPYKHGFSNSVFIIPAIVVVSLAGMKMEVMNEKDKVKYSSELNGITKAFAKLRRIMRDKMPDEPWKWTFYISLVLLVFIYAFFGYKLYRSLTEKDRKREEKLKAKQSKKKK